MTSTANIVWFRRDLRVADNPALRAAASGGAPLIPLFVEETAAVDPWRPAAVARESERLALARLDAELRARGSRLVTLRGSTPELLGKLIAGEAVGGVYWNRRPEPFQRELERRVLNLLRERGVRAHASDGGTLFAPAGISTATGTPYRVFTPFWRACLAHEAEIGDAHPAPERLSAPARWPGSEEFGLSDAPPALEALPAILERVDAYEDLRDRPDLDATSRLSTALHFGEIGVRQLWHAVRASGGGGAESFLRQLIWREFAYHLLHHFPGTPECSMRGAFESFPWQQDGDALERWKEGRTGYPIVDAGMRQLLAEGWMHNRVRLIAASFLVKHLLIDWREGARHFWNRLSDADLANNTMGWQWIAGCGVDAAPYFRIFNPVLQARRFDPRGDYVRRWIPELSHLPDRWIHQPWAAPGEAMTAGEYPAPIIGLAPGRKRALEAYAEISG